MPTVPTTGHHTGIDPADVTTYVALAKRVLPQTWGLDTFVAVNPLHGFEELPFDEAVGRAADLFGAEGYLPVDARRALLAGTTDGWVPSDPDPDGRPTTTAPGAAALRTGATELHRRGTAVVADLVDVLVAHWCATHAGAAHRAGGLHAAWRALAPHDRLLRTWCAGVLDQVLGELADDPNVVTSRLLHALGVEPATAVAYLEAQLARLPGWGAALARTGALVELVAIRLTVERLLLDGPAVPRRPPAGTPRPIGAHLDDVAARAEWQEHAELRYRDELLGMLTRPEAAGPGSTPATDRPDSQVICCIDVRSESLRRHLEAVGPHQTLGFAGFFGLPIAVQTYDAEHPVASCPVILDPRAHVVEEVIGGRVVELVDRERLHRSFHSAKVGAASAFALAEATGIPLGVRSLADAAVPGARRRATRLGRRRSNRTRFRLERTVTDPRAGLGLDEQVTMAQGALVAMGLTRGFAPLVVICGHRSSNRNNPFRSALDCGACGGNAGGPNARILATICNRTDVRQGLAAAGIDIADNTWFVAAEHETTDDVVTFLDDDLVPASHRDRLERLRADLAVATQRSRVERRRRMPAPASAGRRSDDPAQVVPDWGLARCAAIVVGPRSLTAGLDLDRRVFLHSHEPDDDPDGLVLEAIMTGPVVVAHWICSQYYFSTVDPRRFGAGSKPLHNVIDRLGVAEGTGLDLRIGLPLESVWFDGRPVHDPLRLLVVIDAPHERVEQVVARNPVLRRLFTNGWARLVARSSDGSGFGTRGRDGSWDRWEPPHDDHHVDATTVDTTCSTHIPAAVAAVPTATDRRKA
jgi:uncharacterized protein YbcC (UPF0753/DUF2309 family)